MGPKVQIAPQPPAGQDPAAALSAAAAKLVRASIEMLVQQAGQPLTGKIVVPPPNFPPGLTQIAVAEQLLTLKLSTPLPAGTTVRLDVQQTISGQPAVTVQQLPAPGPSAAPPSPMPQPAPAMPSTVVTQMPAPPAAPQQSLAQPTAPATAPAAPVTALIPAPAAAQPTPQLPAASAPAPTPPMATPSPPGNSAPAPAVTVSQPVAAPGASVPSPAPTAAPPPAMPAPTQAASAAPTMPATTLAAPAAPTPLPAPVSAPLPLSPSGTVPAVVLPQGAASVVPAPVAPTVQLAASPAPPQPAAPAPPANPPAVAAPVTPPAAQPQSAQVLLQRLTQAFAPPPISQAPAAPAGSPAQLIMAATTQAAARQQSAAPLLQALAVALPQLPKSVADAAAQVLANRVSLDRGAPSGEGLKAAVLKSGVFLEPPGKAGSPPDLRQALTALRGSLLAWLGDDIAAIAPVVRRPPPPGRGAVPRGQPPDLPLPPSSEGKEAGKALLGQTEGALSRIKLMQLSTQPADAARPASVPGEWNLELPMLLGRELAMAQIQIQRDGKGKAEAREKPWRLRFALRFSVLGEVGAQVSMLGNRTSIAMWADEEATAETLDAMLPELAPALAAKGLELVSLTVRRGVPKDEAQASGRLMDSTT